MRWTTTSSLAVLLGLSAAAARAHAAPPHRHRGLTGHGSDLAAADADADADAAAALASGPASASPSHSNSDAVASVASGSSGDAASGSGSGSGPGSGAATGSNNGSNDGSGPDGQPDAEDDIPYLANQVWDASVYARDRYADGDTIPGARQQDTWNQTAVLAVGGSDDFSQNPHCDTVFIGTAAVTGSFTDGWEALPSVLGFDLMRDLWVNNPDEEAASVSASPAGPGSASGSGSDSESASGAVFPYYIEHGKNASLIKRAIIAIPGVPRDSWKVVNEVRNSFICTAYANDTDLDLSEILILGPAWLTAADRGAGAGEADDLYWPAGNNWANGVASEGPRNVSISSFSALDALVSLLFDESAFPNLNNVVVAGHSVGGALSQRYASIRSGTDDDPDLIYWAGNPSVYTWPSQRRPVAHPPDQSCNSTRNQWPYGLDLSNASASGRLAYALTPPTTRAARASTSRSLQQQYLTRHVHVACGLDDHLQGASQCEAAYQGSTHLTRCQNLEKQVGAFSHASNGTWDYIPNTAHEEYLMFSARETQERLFINLLDTRMTALRSTNSSAAAGHLGTGLTGVLSPTENQTATQAQQSQQHSSSAARSHAPQRAHYGPAAAAGLLAALLAATAAVA